MIPRVASLGTGFAGAGKYYLHDQRPDGIDNAIRPDADTYFLNDKHGAQTSERVGFTVTRNLPTQDPHKALRCMAWLAANADNVKQAAAAAAAKTAGMSYAAYVKAHNPFRGRKQEKPVYTLSIAWHPTKNKRPSQAEMIAAGDEVLRALGLQDRQALMVEHTDRPHPHLHLIINRVSPADGKLAKVGNDYLKLSRWALDYEKRTGQVLCFDRVVNWEKRDAARLDKAERRQTNAQAKGTYVLARDVPRRDHDWFRTVAHLPADEIRKARLGRQEREREQLTRRRADRSMTLEGHLTRRYGLELKDAENEIDRLRRAEHWRKKRDQHPIALLLSPRHAFHALVDLATGRKYFRPRKIKALQGAAVGLRSAMSTARHVEVAKYSNAETLLRQRHAAERKRDEERIAALTRAARGKGSEDRTRKVFNLRGAVETARLLSPKQPAVRLSDIHSRVVEAARTKKLAAKSALARLVNAIGGKVTASDLRRKTISGWQRPITQPAVDQQLGPTPPIVSPAPAIEQARRPIHQPGRQTTPISTSDTRAFEARRDAVLDRIERDNAQAKRRRRKRPRGKTRRLT